MADTALFSLNISRQIRTATATYFSSLNATAAFSNNQTSRSSMHLLEIARHGENSSQVPRHIMARTTSTFDATRADSYSEEPTIQDSPKTLSSPLPSQESSSTGVRYGDVNSEPSAWQRFCTRVRGCGGRLWRRITRR